MSRYIDENDIIKNLKPIASKMSFGIQSDIANAIVSAPSIDIVRCKECKYKQQCHKAVEHTTRDRTSVSIGYRPIDFCSYGEREGE